MPYNTNLYFSRKPQVVTFTVRIFLFLNTTILIQNCTTYMYIKSLIKHFKTRITFFNIELYTYFCTVAAKMDEFSIYVLLGTKISPHYITSTISLSKMECLFRTKKNTNSISIFRYLC